MFTEASKRDRWLFVLGCTFSFAIFSHEFFDSSGRIDEFLLAGKKRMAGRADIDAHIAAGRANLKSIAAGAGYRTELVFGMDFCFHDLTYSLYFRKMCIVKMLCLKTEHQI